jgi:hypothetical protein
MFNHICQVVATQSQPHWPAFDIAWPSTCGKHGPQVPCQNRPTSKLLLAPVPDRECRKYHQWKHTNCHNHPSGAAAALLLDPAAQPAVIWQSQPSWRCISFAATADHVPQLILWPPSNNTLAQSNNA